MASRVRLVRMLLVFFLISLLIGSFGYYYLLLSQQPEYPDRSEWAYDMIEASNLNGQGYYGTGVTVAIIDTGIDLSHPELKHYKKGGGELIWMDYVNNKADPYDDNGHGTAMAGLIAGKNYGLAPKVKLIVLKTITADGSGNVDDIAEAIDYATRKGADVISLSLGGASFPIIGTSAEEACEDAINYFGVFIVAAAGNDGENDNGEVDSPSNVDWAISVGAVDKTGAIASFSSMGDNDGLPLIQRDDREDPNKKPEVVAPGVDINVPLNDGQYGVTSGTSVATAFVSGIIALTLEAHENYQRENTNGDDKVREYKRILMETASPPSGQSSNSHHDHYGYGIIKGAQLNEKL